MEAIATLLVDARCHLAEGIVWWEERDALLWTDIPASTLWLHDAASGRSRQCVLPSPLGSFAICESGRLLLALAKTICLVDLDAAGGIAAMTSVAELEMELPTTRANDGRPDRSGNFVFGTMNEDPREARIGSFYQFSARHGLRRLDLDAVAIANSICFSLDGGTMYFCDSPQRRILQGDYEPDRARVTNVRDFVVFGDRQGLPDGSVIDGEGCLWNAEWGTGMVRRYTPDGRIDRGIRIPTKHPTCPAFGGKARDALFITTARKDLTEQDLADTPEAGGVFRASPGVQGVPDGLFRDR